MTIELETLQALIDANDQPVFALDTGLHYTAFNRAHANIMRALYGAEIVFGGRLPDYQTVVADRETALANIARALAGERVVAGAFSGADGQQRFFEVTHAPQTDPAGQVVGVLVEARDVTGQRRTENELRESEDKFKYVFDYSPLGKSITLPTGEIHVNQAFCRMIGYSQEELEQTRWQDITPPADIELTQKQLDPILSGQSDQVRFVKRYVHKNGSTVWADVATALRRNQAGEALYFVTTVVDITEQRVTQASLAASEERHRELVDHMTSGVVVYEPTPGEEDFLILDFNAAAERIEKIDRRSVVGKLVTEAFPGVEEFGLIDVLRRVARTGKAERFPTALYQDKRLSSWRENDVYRLPSGEVVATYADVTERVLAEQEAARAKELMERAEEIGHIGGWQYDVASARLTWTEEVYRIHGVEPDFDPNDIGRDIAFYAPEGAPRVAEAFRRAVQSGEPYDLEVELDRADGTRIWVRTVGHPVSEDGAVVQVVGDIMDITTRKRAEAELRESRDYLENLFGYANAPVIVWDPELRVTRFNRAFEELTGRTADEVVGRHLKLLFPEDDRRAKALAHVTQASAGERWRVVEIPILRADGDVRTVLWNSATVYGADGVTPVATIAQGQDVTERVHAEEELRETSERLALACLAGGVGIWELDVESGALIWDAQMYDLYGVPPDQFSGTYAAWRAGVHPEDVARTETELELTLRGEREFDTEFRVVWPNGSVRTIRAMARVQRDDAGRPARLIGTNYDVTAFKRADDEVRRLNAELEQRVLERTTQLDAANKELEAFAYSVSHDLRAPLRHISGFASILAEDSGDSLDDEGRHCLDTISDSVREMGVLIDDLLQFSRVGRTEMQIADVDMEVTLSEALQPIREETQARAIEWSIGPLPHILGDHALLRQVWANLLDNAVKYSRARAPARIEVGTIDGMATADEAGFFVRDNGVGFDMQYADKLFGVFQRLHDSSEFEGTGVGLANVQRIVTRLGGRVWAEAELDKGATFFFTLPTPKESRW